MKRFGSPAAIGISAVAGAALLFASAAPALAGTVGAPPAYDASNTAVVGQLGFTDASGNPVTTGNINDVPFTYAVGNAVVRAGDTNAVVQMCTPQQDVNPATWTCDTLNAYTKYPVTGSGVPSNISGDTKDPISTETQSDLTFGFYQSEIPNASTASQADYELYQLRLRTSNPSTSAQPTLSYDVADIKIVGDVWTLVYGATTPAVTPPPALPEAPLATGLPLAGLAVIGGVYAVSRRRRRHATAQAVDIH